MATKRIRSRRAAPSGRPSRRVAQPASVQRTIASAVAGGEMLSAGVLNLVKHTLTAARGSIRAASEIGGDLGLVAKGATKSAIAATEQIGGDLTAVARSVAQGAVKATADVGGDVAKTARKAVEGAIEATRDVGGDVAGMARSAAEGAIEAADRLGSVAGRAVRRTLSGTIAGVRNVVGVTPARSRAVPRKRRRYGRRSRRNPVPKR